MGAGNGGNKGSGTTKGAKQATPTPTPQTTTSPSTPDAPPKKVIGKPFGPGNPGGPGRPRLPDFLKNGGKSEKVLRELEKAAENRATMEKESDWLRAVTLYLEYTVGPPKHAFHARGLPETAEERIKVLEAVVFEAAINNTTAEAAVRMLEALDPTRWGKKQSEGESDDQVDTVDWVPLVRTQTH